MSTDRDIIETKAENRAETTEEKVGEGIGGVGGAAAGAALGSAAGPIGTIIGGIAGAVGGWWAGEKAGRAVAGWTDADDTAYRKHYEKNRGEIPTYDDARVGYKLGHTAALHPGYGDSDFEDVEADLRHGFVTRDYDWEYTYDELRPYIREGYVRSRTR